MKSIRTAIKSLRKEPIVRSGVANGFALAIKTVTGFVISKIIAIFAGPSGLALVGQLNNFATMAQTAASAGMSMGVVKFVAQFPDERVDRYLSASLKISVISTILSAAGIIIFREPLSESLFKTAEYSGVLVFLAISLAFFSIATLFMSIINGRKQIRKFAFANITANVLTAGISALLIVKYHVFGALCAIPAASIPLFIASLYFVRKTAAFSFKGFFGVLDMGTASQLLKYSLMSLVTALAYPVSQIIVRNYIMTAISQDAAGYWQSVVRISDFYFAIVATSFGVYYLPRLSELTEVKDIRADVRKTFLIVIPAMAALALLVYLLRDLAIAVLYTKQFSVARDLFAFQLLGDVLKAMSWVLSMLMVAKSKTRTFILTEIGYHSAFAVLGITGISVFGLVGATYAYAACYALYFAVFVFLYRTGRLF